ncbi:MAG TPA: histone deacetylase family protein [Woeseiaceae bacterium]|nr:histone deacetylase family protein [Woeseiaceae bacterium]
MITVFSADHELHRGLLEASGDDYKASPECPERANHVIAALQDAGLGEMRGPAAFDARKLIRVHAQEYVDFLQNAWAQWQQAGMKASNARAQTFVCAGLRDQVPRSILGRLGRYAFDDSAPIVAGSWQAIRRSADIALTGADIVKSVRQNAFALCRPPGHHASREMAGGYCYLNNAAIAAQAMIDAGMDRIAVLDVDYHHGNGTQSIFYERNDVLTVSLHADPADEYPYFLGYSDEQGAGKGHGFNVNYPLPLGTMWNEYQNELDDALALIRRFSPPAVVVALGLDTYAGDPTTRFGIETGDYIEMGRRIRSLGIPVLTVLEGGYAVDAIGRNAVAFLRGVDGQ